MFCFWYGLFGCGAGTGRADAEGRVGPVVNSLPAVMPLTMGIGAMFKWWANEDKKCIFSK